MYLGRSCRLWRGIVDRLTARRLPPSFSSVGTTRLEVRPGGGCYLTTGVVVLYGSTINQLFLASRVTKNEAGGNMNVILCTTAVHSSSTPYVCRVLQTHTAGTRRGATQYEVIVYFWGV